MSSHYKHTFIIRLWQESDALQSDGNPLWRGSVQHVGSGQNLAFQSLDEALDFIQDWTRGWSQSAKIHP